MTMPWTCDALLPQTERYASLKYRRVARQYDATRLAYDDACELVAMVQTVGPAFARLLFLWPKKGQAVRETDRLLKHLSHRDDVVAMVDQNMIAATRADGLACLSAMRDGGWTKGPVPKIVRNAFLDMRDAGMSQPAIAQDVDLTLDQVRVMANGRRDRPRTTGLAGLVAA